MRGDFRLKVDGNEVGRFDTYAAALLAFGATTKVDGDHVEIWDEENRAPIVFKFCRTQIGVCLKDDD